MFKNQMGKAIRDLRIGREESQEALASAVGATRREIQILEEGRQTLDGRALFLLKKISLHFETSADEWLHLWAADAGDAELEKGGRG